MREEDAQGREAGAHSTTTPTYTVEGGVLRGSRVVGVCVSVYYCRTYYKAVCVCVLLLQDLLQSCSRGGRRRVEDGEGASTVCVTTQAREGIIFQGLLTVN